MFSLYDLHKNKGKQVNIDSIYNLSIFSKEHFLQPLKILLNDEIRLRVCGVLSVLEQEEGKKIKSQSQMRCTDKAYVIDDETYCPNTIVTYVYDTRFLLLILK